MQQQGGSAYNAQIYQEACEWLVEFRTGEPDEAKRETFHAWLQMSPLHMEAYLDVAVNWHSTSSIDLTRFGSRDELIAQAAYDPDVVVAHPSALRRVAPTVSRDVPHAAAASGAPATGPVAKTPRYALAACVAAAFLIVGMVGVMSHAPTYSTGIGEQRSIALRDGSTVNLNSRSRIRIDYSTRKRGVELLQGQALFHVAKDAARPFIVSAGTTQVRAVGTEFDVYRKPTGTVVTVVEGRVAVMNGSTDLNGTPEAQPLSAGEQLLVTSRVVPHPAPANVAAVTAWMQRQLIFDSTPLTEVAGEFNRYNERQFVIRDPALRTFQIDGVFSSTDPSSLIRFLRARPEMQVTETDSEIVIARR
ncbi:MAG: FecR domain-containing protein [Gammaproteobacteria bacterium]